MLSKTMLGLKMNLEKIKLIPIERVKNVVKLALELGCRVGELLSTYMGHSLSAPFRSVAA